MEPTYVQDEDPALVSGAGEDQVPATPEGNEGDQPADEDADESTPGRIEPEKAVDEDGNDVFDGYSYLAPRADRDSIIEEELDEDVQADADTAGQESQSQNVAGRSAHVHDLDDSANTASTSDEIYSSSSTRPTSIEREVAELDGPKHLKAMKSKASLIMSEMRSPLTDNQTNLPAKRATRELSSEEPEDEWDVVDVPEAGLSDCNGRRGKRTNNTLFALVIFR